VHQSGDYPAAMPVPTGPRFLKLDQVAEELNNSDAQVYALVKRGDLKGIQIGGRGQWRVERAKLEEFITAAYRAAEAEVEGEPPAGVEAPPADEPTGLSMPDAPAGDP
jgi:excisionase family DNA binding protein